MKPTEVDSMNALRVQAERKAALYRRALELACNGDSDQVAYFVSEADAAIDADRAQDAAAGVDAPPAVQPVGWQWLMAGGRWGFCESERMARACAEAGSTTWRPVYAGPCADGVKEVPRADD